MIDLLKGLPTQAPGFSHRQSSEKSTIPSPNSSRQGGILQQISFHINLNNKKRSLVSRSLINPGCGQRSSQAKVLRIPGIDQASNYIFQHTMQGQLELESELNKIK